MRDKDANSHKRQVIKIKQNRGLAVIQKYKLGFEEQVGRKISFDKYIAAVSCNKNPCGKAKDLADFGCFFEACCFSKHS